jgi:hypothetical protein
LFYVQQGKCGSTAKKVLRLAGWVEGAISDPALVISTLDQDVAIHTPVGSPIVLNLPIFVVIILSLGAIAN